MEPQDIEGAWTFTPTIFPDERGYFLEQYQSRTFEEHLGYPLRLAQVNCSVSRQGVLRGIHFSDVPPGQAKFVFCVQGTILDVVVDVRAGSPDFGRWAAVELDDVTRRAVYLAEGLGHGFVALSEQATVVYLTSSSYVPGSERTVNPLDPEIGVDWPLRDATLSAKDTEAPSLADAGRAGILPSYDVCRELRRAGPSPASATNRLL